MTIVKRNAAVFGFLSSLLVLGGGLAVGAEPGGITAGQLKCEYAVNPLGIDAEAPRFSWVLGSTKRGRMQSAYRVLVASSAAKLGADTGDKWDSGKVSSSQSVNVAYKGKPLASREICWWKVCVWPALSEVEGDNSGARSSWSKPAKFEMGLLKKADWKGQWIGVALPGPPAALLDAAKPGRANVALYRRSGSVGDRGQPLRGRRFSPGAAGRRLLQSCRLIVICHWRFCKSAGQLCDLYGFPDSRMQNHSIPSAQANDYGRYPLIVAKCARTAPTLRTSLARLNAVHAHSHSARTFSNPRSKN